MKVVFGACVLAVVLSGCCKKPTESNAGGGAAGQSSGSQASEGGDAGGAVAVQPAVREYVMDKPGDATETYIRLKKVTVTKENTTINVNITNSTKHQMSISTSPPGQITTFYIQSQSHDKRFNLIRSEGIAITPKTQKLQPGQSTDFTLVFAPLDPDMTVFDVYEGDKKSQKGGTTYWNFSDVTLK